jgi:DNA-binding response OmpR family regulator
VLVVDHDRAKRTALRRRLSGGHLVISAATPDEAYTLLNLHTPRLVLLGTLPAGEASLLLHRLLRDARMRGTRVRAAGTSLGSDHGHRLSFRYERSVAA